MKYLIISIFILLTLSSSAWPALKPLPGALDIACRQFRIKANGEKSTVYFRTTADMSKIKKNIELYNTGLPVSKGFMPLFDLSWSVTAKSIVSECVQVRGDSGDFSGQYLLRVILTQKNKASFISDSIIGEALDDILYGLTR